MSPDDAAPTSASTPSAPSSAPPAKPKPVAKAPAKPATSTPSAPASPSKPATTKPAAPTPAKPAPAAKPVVAKPVEKKAEPAAKKWEQTRKSSTTPATPPPKVIDATGLVLGRAAAVLAKRLIQGEHLVVVNTEKAVVLGGRADVLERYRVAVARGSVRKGPHYPRRPDRIFRRTVRGMLPFVHYKGREAWSRIQTYVGVPEEFKAFPKETLEGAKARPSLRTPTTLGEISHHVGGLGPW